MTLVIHNVHPTSLESLLVFFIFSNIYLSGLGWANSKKSTFGSKRFNKKKYEVT